MLKKGISYLLLSTMIFTLVFSGCTKKNEQSPSPGTGAEGGTGGNVEMVGNMYKTGLPIVKDKMTFKVAVHRPNHIGAFADMPLLKELEEKTNIHIEWIEYNSDGLKEKVNVMLASGDYPDMAWRLDMTDSQYLTYGNAGAILKLNDLVENYAPNWKAIFEKYPYVKKVATAPNGSIYSLPFVRMEEAASGMRDAWLINKSWLDKLNLKMPATTEDFREVLKAFKEKDPNGNGKADEIPWTFRFNQYSNGQYDIFGSFGVLHGARGNIGVKDGKVFYTSTDKGVKEALIYLNTLYKDGVIDKEAFTQNASQFQAKLQANPEIVGSAAVYAGAGATEFGRERIENEVYVPMLPLQGPSGQKPMWRQQTNTVERGYFTIFSTNKYPEISMRWANELAEEKFSLQSQKGILGTHIKEEANGKFVGISDQDVGKSVPLNFGPFALTPEIVEKVELTWDMKIRTKFYNLYKPYVVPLEDIYPRAFLNEEQNKVLAKYETDLSSYVQQTQARWIVEGGIEAEWDGFVKKVKEMGVDEIIRVYQEALNTFNKN